MPKRRLVVAYLCLVGVPLLALVGILRAGRRLTPPISVGGAWTLDADSSALAGSPCEQLLAGIKQPFFTVSQSGTEVIFVLNNPQRTTISGTIEGATLTAGAGGPEASQDLPGNCGDPQAIYLRATVQKQNEQRTLTGILGFNPCQSCPPLSFRAVRQTPAARGVQ